MAGAIRQIGVSEVTYYRWRQEFGGLKTEQVKRPKDLELENCRLRKAVSDLSGSNYRLRQHADLMPEHVRSKAIISSPIPAQPPRRRGRPSKNGVPDHTAA
jgi:hypothetical protein